MATPASPSSSPRIPSPPPLAEVQEPPTSPGLASYEDNSNILGANSVDAGAGRRIRPGTKREDMAEGPPLVELQEIDSAFQLTEHLKALHYHHTHPPSSTTIHPITASVARDFAHPPPNTSKEIWLYELARFLIQKTNAIIVHLFADDPPCSPATCPEMRASEWQYLCAVHDPPKSCSAIDYCCHTLDWAATSLTSSKMFPSRLGLGSGNVGGGSDKMLQQQMKEITNIFRRVYRIYAHAWFQHRDMFWRVEESTGLYIFFKTVCDEYGMIQPENYTIPLEAEGGGPAAEDDRAQLERVVLPPPTILRPEAGEGKSESKGVSRGDTTKRHTRIPSNMAPLTTVIQEEAEDEEETKPGLDRHTTVIPVETVEKDNTKEERNDDNAAEAFPKFETESSETALKEEKAATPEVSTTDSTLPKTELKRATADNEEDADDVTILEAEPDVKQETPGVEVKVEAVEVEEEEEEEESAAATETVAEPTAKAGDAAEAGKTVAD